MEIFKYWQVFITLFIAVTTVYFTVKQTAKNTDEIKEHDKRISDNERSLINAINDRNIKLAQIDSQLSHLKASNDRIVKDYQEIKEDLKSINKTMHTMNDLLIKISTTCNLKIC